MSTGDYDDIRALMDDWVQALRAKDADATIACQSDSIRFFSLAPPLEDIGNHRDGLQTWLNTWTGNLIFEVSNTDLRVGGDIAWCSALARLGGQKIGQGMHAFWMRITLAFAREEGRWLIAHIHQSVPFSMQGQPLGLFDLKP